MSRRLIRYIDPWSVAKTVFPLAWLIGTVGVMFVYVVAGSMLMEMASDLYDAPPISGVVGTVAIVVTSFMTGFIYSIVATIISFLGTLGYNMLANLGGGFEFELEDVAPVAETVGRAETSLDRQLTEENST